MGIAVVVGSSKPEMPCSKAVLLSLPGKIDSNKVTRLLLKMLAVAVWSTEGSRSGLQGWTRILWLHFRVVLNVSRLFSLTSTVSLK